MATARTSRGALRRLHTLLETQGDKWKQLDTGRHTPKQVESFCVMGGAGYVIDPVTPKNFGENETLQERAFAGDVVAQATLKALYTALPAKYQSQGKPERVFEIEPKPEPPKLDPPRIEDFYVGDSYDYDEYERAHSKYQSIWDDWILDVEGHKNDQPDWPLIEDCIFAFNDDAETHLKEIKGLVKRALTYAA